MSSQIKNHTKFLDCTTEQAETLRTLAGRFVTDNASLLIETIPDARYPGDITIKWTLNDNSE